MHYEPLIEKEETIAKNIVDSAFKVHSQLGPDLLKKVYEVCFCYELGKRGLAFKRQVNIPISYNGMQFDEGLRIDVLVEELIVCKLKSVDQMIPVFDVQLLTYLKLTNIRLGFLINFNVPLIKDGIKRLIL